MDKISKDNLDNNVSAENQLEGGADVAYFGSSEPDFKITFVGNSITRHMLKPEELGWKLDCGMAASAPEKDYVHLCVSALEKKYGKVRCCIAQAAKWERDWTSGTILENLYSEAAAFVPDLLVVRIGENTKRELLADNDYEAAFDRMVKFFIGNSNAKVVITGMFWRDERLETAMKAVAEKRGYSFVSIEDLGDRDDMKAIGLFEHYGVSIHPGDLGMKNIAERITKATDALV